MPRVPIKKKSNPSPKIAVTVGGKLTLRELAEIVGVTKVTISRALNNPHLVSSATLQRVQDVVRQTGYIPNLLAGSLASSKSRLIVAVVPAIAGAVFQEMTGAMTTALHEAGYQLLIGQGGYDESREDALLDAIIGRRPAGIVLTGIAHSAASRQRLKASGIPVVETWDITRNPIDMLVGFSHKKIGAEVARYLRARGAHRPALITPDDSRALARGDAFVAQAKKLFGCAEVPTYRVSSPTTMGHGRRALAQLLREHPDIDSVFCGTDTLALGVLIEARAVGRKIPARLKVVGYGDLNFAADTDPPLTTVRIDGTGIGRMTAQMLIRRIEGQEVEHSSRDVGFQLMERGSA